MSTASALSGKRILAIDDDPSMRDFVAHILVHAGCRVEVADNGAAGLQRIRAQAPDLILCDVNMPEMDGFATLQAVRADPGMSALPFILLTALDNRDNVRRGMRLGADDFLSKPVRAEELIESVDNALGRNRRLREQRTDAWIADHGEARLMGVGLTLRFGGG